MCFISWAWQKHGHKKTIPLSKREVKQGAKSMLMEPKNLVMEQLLQKAQAILLYVWEKEKKNKCSNYTDIYICTWNKITWVRAKSGLIMISRWSGDKKCWICIQYNVGKNDENLHKKISVCETKNIIY